MQNAKCKMLCLLPAACCLLLVGCAKKPVDKAPLTQTILHSLALEGERAPSPPAPVIDAKCDGSGFIIHGDGHRTPCPGCVNCRTQQAAGSGRQAEEARSDIWSLDVGAGNILFGVEVLEPRPKPGDLLIVDEAGILGPFNPCANPECRCGNCRCAPCNCRFAGPKFPAGPIGAVGGRQQAVGGETPQACCASADNEQMTYPRRRFRRRR